MPSRKTIGQAIEDRRTELGMSRAALAKKLRITRRQVWRVETGGIRVLADDVPRIARALATNVTDLYGRCA
jgi:transcriptional regulator with XRE-family HTH domain